MEDDLFNRDYSPQRPPRDNLFGWTIVILLLIGVAMACWLGSYAIFGHPERPKSYAILRKLKKIEPPKRFELTAAPAGEFLSPQKIYDRYASMSDLELARENDELLREYVTSYRGISRLVPYVTGRFTILETHELGTQDLFPTGVAALTQAVDFPQILTEHIYPSDTATVPSLRQMLTTGLEVKLERTLDLSAIVHLEKLADGRLQVTVVPLTYGTYTLRQGSGTFNLSPPTELSLAAGLPVVRGDERDKVLKARAFAIAQPGVSLNLDTPAPANAATPPPAPALVRVNTPPPTPTPVETPAPTPALAQTTPEPTLEPTATPVPLAKVTPTPTPPKLALNTRPTPTPILATPVPTTAGGVQLKPFLAAAATPQIGTTSRGNWRTFAPGQMPRGRLVDVRETSNLASTGLGGQRIYLRGNFTVTASGENRAVLRAQGGNFLRSGPDTSTRVIVEFPSGSVPPPEGSALSRDEARPFQITDVRRGADGQVNVYVREITQ